VSVAALSATERETVIQAADDGADVSIWTAQSKVINRLKKHPSFTLVGEGFYGSTAWASFTIPAADWNPASGAKRQRKPLTDSQKSTLRMRLAEARAASGSSPKESK
jgi:hypothetical protein